MSVKGQNTWPALDVGRAIARGQFSGNDLALAKAIVQDIVNALLGK